MVRDTLSATKHIVQSKGKNNFVLIVEAQPITDNDNFTSTKLVIICKVAIGNLVIGHHTWSIALTSNLNQSYRFSICFIISCYYQQMDVKFLKFCYSY